MKIAFTVPGGVDRSGRERVIPHVLWLIEALAREHEVHVVSFRERNPEPEDYELLGARIHALGHVGESQPRSTHPAEALQVRYRRALESFERHGPWDAIHGLWALTAGWIAVRLGRELNVPSVVSLMGAELVAFPAIDYGAQRLEHLRNIVAETVAGASCLTVASDFMARRAREFGLQTRLIPFGVHRSCFAAGAATHEPPWRLLHAGSINRIKDQFTLVRALRHARALEPRLQLDIVGEDTLHGEVQGLAYELGLDDCVKFHGFMPNQDLRALFRAAHLYLVSSINETGPIAMLEAAACGVPTVGTRVGYVADWADTRALAVDVGDAQAMGRAIATLLADAPRRAQLGSAALAWTRAHDVEWTASALASIYAGLSGH